jgi:hypothetical protein
MSVGMRRFITLLTIAIALPVSVELPDSFSIVVVGK